MPENQTVPTPDFLAMVRAAEDRAVHPAVSLAAHTIHNPVEPRHFMSLKNSPWRVRVKSRGKTLAVTDDALICLEVGKEMYLPIYYIPLADVEATLHPFKRSTHCPLKGDASYHALSVGEDPIAWSYDAPFDYAARLAGRIAFDHRQVSFETELA
ncbi:DUF427 domain-containing protein [Tateyamaria sp. SN6-1]|uniref:DUF427 domain-containing protein n=1 Tax=Tateyamaria sp. SN6-1 TaxID=3092148 RepID=UPI0039F5C067